MTVLTRPRLGQRGTMTAASLNFFALGVITAGLGPCLPGLAAHTGTSLAAVGAVVTGMFIGAVAMLTVAGLISDRFGQRPLLFAGTLLMVAGLAGLVLSPSLPLLLLSGVVTGLGHGTMDLGTNILIAEVFADTSTAALNLVNVFFAVGAVTGPFVASLTLRWWGTALPALWLGIVLFLPQLYLVPRLAVVPRVARPADAPAGALAHLLRNPLLWLIALLALVYVGGEAGLGSWNTAYLTRTTPLDTATAALVTSGYWLALTAGRIAAASVGMRFTAPQILLSMLIGAAVGGGLLVLGVGGLPLTILAALVLGFCFGPIFPTLLAVIALRFRANTGTAASVIVGMGSLGGAVLPAIQGYLLDRVSPAAYAAFIAGGVLTLLLLYGIQTLAARRVTT
jgi:fucose permease